MKSLIVGAVSVATLAATVAGFSASFRSRVNQQIQSLTEWSMADREADPVGFAEYAHERLQSDLGVMQRTRRELSAEVGSLADQLREKQALHDQALQLAEDFHIVYQEATTDGSFPIELRGAAYTEAQVKSQVSLLLAEADGFTESLKGLQSVQREAESQVEELAVRISSTESQLAMLSTERELLQARLVAGEGNELMAQMDELMTGNQRLIDDNPVRTVAELSAVPSTESRQVASQSVVEEFLAGPSTVRPATFRGTPSNRDAAEERVSSKPARQELKVRQHRTTKPIFQQS